jgi:hypothetical protein
MLVGIRGVRRLAAIAASVVVLTIAGVAFAAWTSDGSGSGSATSGTSASSLIASATAGTGLYPGAIKTLTVTVDNPNSYPVVVTKIIAGVSDAVGTPSCPAGSVDTAVLGDGSAALTPVGGSVSDNKIAAYSGSGAKPTRSYTLTVAMDATAIDACKSQSFTIPLTANLLSAA